MKISGPRESSEHGHRSSYRKDERYTETDPRHRPSMAQHHHMKPAWARARGSKRQPKEAKFQRNAILLRKKKVKRCKKKLFHTVQMYEKDEGFPDRVEFCPINDRLIFVDNHSLTFSYGFLGMLGILEIAKT